MEKIPCSVAMLTFNSGKTLRRALDSVKDFDDLILYDGGSTDDTFAIAEEYGARVIPQDKKYLYPDTGRLADGGGARNQMMEAAKYDWYLWIDSDESISPGLHADVARIVAAPFQEGDPLAYRIPIALVIDGRVVKYSSNYPGYQYRFFNRTSGGRLMRRAHNRIEFNPGTPIGTLAHPWYTYFSLKDYGMFDCESKHYRRVEIEGAASRTLPDFLYFVVWHVRAAAGLFLKACWSYLRHGFRETMPVRMEVGRVLSPLILVARSSLFRLKKMFS